MSESKIGSESHKAGKHSRFSRPVKLMNRLGITSVLAGIAIALIKAWATYWFGPGQASVQLPAPAQQTPAQQASVADTQPRTVEDLLRSSPVSLLQWQMCAEKSYANGTQRERSFREFVGRKVVWEGYFDQVNEVRDATDPSRGTVLIVQESRSTLFEQRSLLGPPFIRCWLSRSAFEKCKGMEKGDWIVVSGRLLDPLLAGSALCTDLSECEVITCQKVRAVEAALSPTDVVIR